MSIKELHEKLSQVPDILENGEDILILKNSKPAFSITAINRKGREKEYNMEDLKKIQFSDGEKDLSNKIDKYIYS